MFIIPRPSDDQVSKRVQELAARDQAKINNDSPIGAARKSIWDCIDTAIENSGQ